MTVAERIAEIRKRYEAATSGAWFVRSHGVGQFDTPTLETMTGGLLARFTHYYPMKEDAVFCAEARIDIPWLLSQLEKAERYKTDANRSLGLMAITTKQLESKLKIAEEALERISSNGGVYPKVCADLALTKIREQSQAACDKGE